jgi:hypothetical protein
VIWRSGAWTSAEHDVAYGRVRAAACFGAQPMPAELPADASSMVGYAPGCATAAVASHSAGAYWLVQGKGGGRSPRHPDFDVTRFLARPAATTVLCARVITRVCPFASLLAWGPKAYLLVWLSQGHRHPNQGLTPSGHCAPWLSSIQPTPPACVLGYVRPIVPCMRPDFWPQQPTTFYYTHARQPPGGGTLTQSPKPQLL